MLSGFLLYIRSVDINDREIISVDRFDDGFDIFTNFIVILFEIVGNDDVEDDVGMCRTRDHTEIVDGQRGVDAGDEGCNLFANRFCDLIVRCDRVHMDDGIAVQMLAQFFFDIVDHIVRFEQIGVAGYLGVE